MKLIEKNPTVKTHGIRNTATFGIKESGIGHIFHILRNQLYSDKITAVIREYATNAADAHVEVGTPDRPIEVTLPSRFMLEFRIRDFGPSLSNQEIKDIFAFYGESTKRGTNSQTGMLGIGSKSAFAYGDNFVINAYLDGVKTTYNAFIDDTQVGCIAQLAEEQTTEENGLEIVIPTKTQDVDDFHEKAKSLFKHFRIQPIVNGKQWEQDFDLIYSGDNWRWNANADKFQNAIAVMGNIGYPIDCQLLKLEDSLSDFTCGNLVLECQIGELEISASREGLQYTDYTIQNLIKKIKESAKGMAKELEKSFDDCESLWQAKCLSASLFTYHGKLYSASRVLKKEIQFRGKPIGEVNVELDDDSGIKGLADLLDVNFYTKAYRGHQKVRSDGKSVRINANDDIMLILNTEAHKRGVLKRIVPLVEEDGKKPYLFTFRKAVSPQRRAQIIKKLGMVDSDFTLLTDLPEVNLSASYGMSNRSAYIKNPKISQKVFAYNGGTSWSPQSANWDTAEVDLENEKVVYVEIDRFQYKNVNGGECSSRCLNSIVTNAKLIGIDLKVIGVKPKELPKFQKSDNATLIWDYLKEQTNEKIESLGIVDLLASIRNKEQLDCNWRAFAKEMEGVALGQGTLSDFIIEASRIDSEKNANVKKVEAIRQFAHDVQIHIAADEAPKIDLVELAESVSKLYPLLPVVIDNYFDSWGWRRNDDDKKALVKKSIKDYVNLVNNSVMV